ncbi:hypothetical protein BC629DRAFT_1464014 [Irpex lacteus]|nr:hypothetical protein BC629DRAFT_1464014 [Irpex lacteus]
MKVSFSLKSKAAAASSSKPVGDAPSLKKPVAFASLEDDEPVDAAVTAIAGSSSSVPANKRLIAQNVGIGREEMDATVFEYDEAKARQKAAKEVDSKERKPKYINGLLTSRRRMIQREREMEGDEFKDKEAFVTRRTKTRWQNFERQKRKKRNAKEERKKNKGMGTGMAHFYKKLLEESEQQHEETVAATTQGPTPNLTIVKPPELTAKSDAELARIAREQGKDVELNDDNQITKQSETTEEAAAAHRAVGTAASRKEINARGAGTYIGGKERQEQRVSTGWSQSAIRKTRAECEGRYLARKRRKIEEAEAAPADSEAS